MKKLNRGAKELTAQFFRGNGISFFVGLTATVLSAALNFLISWVIQQSIDAASGVAGAVELSRLAWTTVGIVGAVIVLRAMAYVSRPQFSRRAMSQYKNYAFEKLTQKSIASFRQEETSVYISALTNDTGRIEEGLLGGIFDLASLTVFFIGAVLMMLWYNPILTGVAVGFALLPVAASLLAGNRAEKAEKTVSEKNGKLLATLKDSLSGFSVVKSFRAERGAMALFQKSNDSAENAKCTRRKITIAIGGLSSVAAVTAQIGVFLVGAYMAQRGYGITPGTLFLFLNLTAFVIDPIRSLPELLANGKAALGLVNKLADALDANVRDEGEAIPQALDAGITLRNVSFSYASGTEVLHGINANFQAGKRYAIVGGSGSGKSTLLHLLMASYGDYDGEICYDSREPKTISTESLYDLVSLVQQEVFVFNASARDNITMFKDFPQETVERAIALSGLSEWIAARGEDALCGENGSGLSGGEKQRIAIARSLLRQSSVLLADEVTASLDQETAAQVEEAILNLEGMTRVVITHSLNQRLLSRYDEILAMKDGRIVEAGTFQELMEKRGYFYSLYSISQ